MSGTDTEKRYKDKVYDCDVPTAFEEVNQSPATIPPAADDSADAAPH
jgi:hypothetical protein